MKLYRVIKDRQGGSFAMGYAQSAADWLETMIGWRDSDDSWGDWGNGKGTGYYDDRERAIKWWQNQIKTPEGEQDLINYIDDIWDLDFQTIDENLQAAYEQYKSEFNPAEGEPVCLSEWLDCEAVELGLVEQSAEYR